MAAVFAPNLHALTLLTSGSGTAAADPSPGPYTEGSSVVLTATPAAGWQFSGWSGDLRAHRQPATLLIDADKTVTATFTPIPRPVITTPPVAQIRARGRGRHLHGRGHRASPLLYQWRKNGDPLPVRRRTRCFLAHVQIADAGLYSGGGRQRGRDDRERAAAP